MAFNTFYLHKRRTYFEQRQYEFKEKLDQYE